jgi:hypothetical protein
MQARLELVRQMSLELESGMTVLAAERPPQTFLMMSMH